jgi:hypothetical protein
MNATLYRKPAPRLVNLIDAPTTPGRVDFLSDQVAAHLTSDPVFIECVSRYVNQRLQNPETIKSLAKSVHVQLKIEQLLEAQEVQSSPFAPIFIADLKPDKIPAGIFAELDSLASITDLSDSIRIDQD